MADFVPGESIDPSTLRPCGECYACCVWLGITELKKYPGQTCKKLDGGQSPCTRCSIYDSRPTACATYSCAWRGGLGPEEARPDRSGLLVTIYPREKLPVDETTEPLPPIAATVVITDHALAGTMIVGNLRAMVDALVFEGLQDIRVVEYSTKFVLHLLNGKIYRAELQKPPSSASFEALHFISFNPPIGTFKTGEQS